ncbi:MAG TPA: hypothetical protein ENJ53_08815, partial [Phaeodactylibacter sp.]|nr:hypothetical protein [Phaeodactylibacter sp.]
NFCVNVQIGGTQAGQKNIIVNNPEGILINNSYNISLRANSMYCNDTAAIHLVNNGNFAKTPPTINVVQTDIIWGNAPTGDVVEVFLVDDSSCQGIPCQGRTLIGTAPVINATWSLLNLQANGIFIQAGAKITATTTSPAGATSSFSPCRTVINPLTCAEPDGTIWVTNTNDEGMGSLRAAIECANSVQGANVIKFNIPDSTIAHQIFVGSQTGQELPALLDDSTTIDATTQSGFGITDFSPKIILNGIQNNWNRPINAIWVRGDYCEIYGLEIINFPDDGIDIAAANHAVIGAPNKGNVIYNNGSEVDFFPGAPNTGPWNGCAVVMRVGASFCTIQGNFLGTNYTRDSTGGNEYCGIVAQSNSQFNQIGGDGVGEANVIAYNEIGVEIRSNSRYCHIQQNIMYCNGEGIRLSSNGNQIQEAPIVDSAATSLIFGKGIPGEKIEIFISDTTNCFGASCQGTIFLGKTEVDADSSWSLVPPFSNSQQLYFGALVTATSTDSTNNTSPFSECKSAIENCDVEAEIEEAINASCGLSNGSITVSVEGGMPPFSFDVGNGNQTSPTFENLNDGVHNIVITDAAGCQDSVEVTLTNTTVPLIAVSNVDAENCDMMDGAFSVQTIGGTAPFMYNIGNGNQASPTFEGLGNGVYTVVVTDEVGCSSSTFIVILDAPPLEGTTANVVDATCNQANGSFEIMAQGGQPFYTYDMGNGATNNNTFTNLSAGTYEVTITDSPGCTTVVAATIGGATTPISFSIINIENENCGQIDGSFEVVATGGTAPYTYSIGSGTMTDFVFENLNAAAYNIVVTDANGCSTSQVFTLEENTVVANVSDIVDENCGAMDGGFTVNGSGGTPPYSYDMGNGATNNNTFTNLSAG